MLLLAAAATVLGVFAFDVLCIVLGTLLLAVDAFLKWLRRLLRIINEQRHGQTNKTPDA